MFLSYFYPPSLFLGRIEICTLHLSLHPKGIAGENLISHAESGFRTRVSSVPLPCGMTLLYNIFIFLVTYDIMIHIGFSGFKKENLSHIWQLSAVCPTQYTHSWLQLLLLAVDSEGCCGAVHNKKHTFWSSALIPTEELDFPERLRCCLHILFESRVFDSVEDMKFLFPWNFLGDRKIFFSSEMTLGEFLEEGSAHPQKDKVMELSVPTPSSGKRRGTGNRVHNQSCLCKETSISNPKPKAWRDSVEALEGWPTQEGSVSLPLGCSSVSFIIVFIINRSVSIKCCPEFCAPF